METTSVGIIIFISFSCLFSLSTAASYNESCASSGDCTGSYQECTNNTCTCTSGYFENGDATGCNAGLGSLCIDVLCHDSSAECVSGTCTCQSTHYVDNDSNVVGGTCTLKKSLGVECPDPTNGVKDTCADTNGECSSDGLPSPTYSCQCKSSYSNQGGTCIDIKECESNPCQHGGKCDELENGYTCTCVAGYTGAECQIDINECLSDPCLNRGRCNNFVNFFNCTCQSGFSGATCAIVALGASCNPQQGTSCGDPNAQCVGTCKCKSSFYDNNGEANSGGTCLTKKVLGDACVEVPGTATCSDSNAICSEVNVNDYKCLCPSSHYDSNGVNVTGGSCKQKGDLGDLCPQPSIPVPATATCKDNFATCKFSNGYKCLCLSAYYDDSGVNDIGGSCKMRKILGKTCRGLTNECADLGAECLDRKCYCGSNYYDTNGYLTEGGSCNVIAELAVQTINFPIESVKTTELMVSWAPPTNRASFVTNYEVSWMLKATGSNSLGNSGLLDSTIRVYVIKTNITPGRAYKVIVKSINAFTHPTDNRVVESSKQQAAQPGKPSNLTTLDLDARDKIIRIGWNAPANGAASSYWFKLLDETKEIINIKQASSPQTLFSNDIKNGKRYNVSLAARSEVYEDSNYVWSDRYIKEIKTDVQEPEPPTAVQCPRATILDNSIHLTWNSPARPNGNIISYKIVVVSPYGSEIATKISYGEKTEYTVTSLNPGSKYIFRIYTVNEMFTSSIYAVSGECDTEAPLAEKPKHLSVDEKGSRFSKISWTRPQAIYSEQNLGYTVKIKANHECVEEHIYQCSDCVRTVNVTSLKDLCNDKVRMMSYKTKTELNEMATLMTYEITNLFPDISYTVYVTAINFRGKGNPAEVTWKTLEEEPQAPNNVKVSSIGTTTFVVSWSLDGPRPGNTNFTINLKADTPATGRDFTVTGFFARSYKINKLEEYWNYSVQVTAATLIGAKASERTQKYRTLPAAPGKVSNLKISDAFGEIYTLMQISWNSPAILHQNGIIEKYSLITSTFGETPKTQSLSQEVETTHEYKIVLNVIPEKTYIFEVYATNVQGITGEVATVKGTAPAGVPINIEDTLHVDIIPLNQLKLVQERQFTVAVAQEFFEESENGQIQASGILACTKACYVEAIKTILDFNTMENWMQSSQKGYTLYRVTSTSWLDEVKMQCSSGRRKRSVTYVDFTIGNGDCKNISTEKYCNGPLQPGTSYNLVAVACTNGGCVLSREYGPFITASTGSCKDKTSASSTQTIAIGIVLGLLNVFLLVYAGYTTLLLRQYRQKESQEKSDDRRNQTYANELFAVEINDARNSSNMTTFGNEEIDTEYSTLDDNTREDKTTYEVLQSNR